MAYRSSQRRGGLGTYDPTADNLPCIDGEPYVYAGDDPVNSSDPSGMLPTGCGIGGSIQYLESHCGGWTTPTGYTADPKFVNWLEAEEGTCGAGWCDANGQCQIGYGHDAPFLGPCGSYDPPVEIAGKDVRPPLSSTEMSELLGQDVQGYGSLIVAEFPGDTQNQDDALTSFTYNLGKGECQTSACNTPCPPSACSWGPGHTLYDYLKSGGTNPGTITADFELYDQPTSLPGILSRRYDEAQMYLYGIYTHAPPSEEAAALFSSACTIEGGLA